MVLSRAFITDRLLYKSFGPDIPASFPNETPQTEITATALTAGDVHIESYEKQSKRAVGHG